jgi:hypothetical protein
MEHYLALRAKYYAIKYGQKTDTNSP